MDPKLVSSSFRVIRVMKNLKFITKKENLAKCEAGILLDFMHKTKTILHIFLKRLDSQGKKYFISNYSRR